MLLGTAMPEKAYVYNNDLPRDTNQQLNDLEVHRDEDAIIDSVSAVNTKVHDKVVGSRIHEACTNLISAWSELRPDNPVTENEPDMVMDMDGQNNSLYHDPQEANRGLMV